MLTPRRFDRFLPLVLLVLLVHPWGRSQADPGEKIRVACLGDSITVGARVDAATESYPARLQQILGDVYEVRNFGIGGATLIKAGRPNVWQALPDAQQFAPHVAVIALGTNDTVSGRRANWEKIDRFEEDYRELIEALAGLPSRPRVLVCTPTAMVLSTPGLSADRLANLQERKPRLAELCRRIRKLVGDDPNGRVTLVDLNPVLEDRPELVSEGDGVHPNAAGYKAIAEAIGKHLAADSREAFPGRPATWREFDQFHFALDGRKAYVVVPKRTAAGKPWVWRARFPDYHAEMDVALLEKGFHVAYIDVAGLFGCPAALDRGDRLYAYLTAEHGFSPQPALEGVSRGGLFVYNWAARHPDRVACIYADTPVCDFKSWPGGKGSGVGSPGSWSGCLEAYGLGEDEALRYAGNPVDNAARIAAAKIPILHVVSENDRVVPPAENTRLLAERLEQHGGSMEILSVAEGTAASGGHHFEHPDPKRVVDFIVRHAARP